MNQSQFNRRIFLQGVASTAVLGPLVSNAQGKTPSINIGCIGVGGKGWSDMHEVSVGHNIVAICDVDEQRLAKAGEKFPKAKRYTSWQTLLEQKDIDAVTVSTPDHTHAPATMSAMQLGKHVYTQKPLTHDVYESRQLTKAASEKKLVTQMGIQHHATRRLKLAVHAIQEGVIGKISEVHVWTDRPGRFWKQGLSRPTEQQTPPPYLKWNHWLGTAPERPFVAGLYHPFHWRGWWDFGTGALGDMGCHLLDPVINALELGPPETITAEGPPPHPESGPEWCLVHYQFPGTKQTTSKVAVHWYEADRQPNPQLFQAPADWPGSKNGVIFIGELGNLFVGFPEMPELFPKEKFSDYKWPDLQDHNHYQEWTTAVATNGITSCPFSYSGPLTETVLLGNVAYRSGKTIHWDSKHLKTVGDPEAQKLIKREYRDGWKVPGLS